MRTSSDPLASAFSIIAKYGVIADLNQCERFGPRKPGAATVERLLCVSPVIYNDSPYAAAILAGGAVPSREALKLRLQDVMKVSGFDFPGTRMISGGDAMILLVPWQFRSEFRAVYSSAVGSASDIDGIAANDAGAHWPGALIDVEPNIEKPGQQSELYRFVLAFESGLQSIVRRVIGKPVTRVWRFPFGCTILESRSKAGTQWEISLDDFEYLDRAYTLVEAVLAKRSGEGGSLRMEYGAFTEEDAREGVETAKPILRLASNDNSRSTRVEMARIVKELILMLVNCRLHGETDILELGQADVEATEAPAIRNVFGNTRVKAFSPQLRR